ncbi:hypothetical protein Bbelb_338060 [Branchiostoma belcheri]|nr:hypothetical protein Bbelb_338060 [Branchiostoma belcheri]
MVPTRVKSPRNTGTPWRTSVASGLRPQSDTRWGVRAILPSLRAKQLGIVKGARKRGRQKGKTEEKMGRQHPRMDRKKTCGNPNPSSQPRGMAADGQALHHTVPPRPCPGFKCLQRTTWDKRHTTVGSAVFAMSLDCEHSLCESCVKQAVPPNCPMCRQEFETPRPNRLCRDILASMRAVCSLCRFTGTVGELVVHRAENCQRQMVYCRHEGCQETVERRHLDVHESTCCHRLEDCLCGMKIKRGSREEHSSTICPSEPIPCPLGCHSHITRGSAVLHTSQDCKRLVHLCRMPGCYFQGGPEEYRAHLAEASAAHVVLLEERLERVQTDCFMMDLKESDISFQRLETRMLVFHILHLKMAISRGSRRFVSPTCGPVLGGTWQVVLEQTGGAWKLYLCLVSRVRPILAKVMFALKAANTADYCIIGKGPRRMMENMRYGVQVPLSKLEAYSAENDGLRRGASNMPPRGTISCRGTFATERRFPRSFSPWQKSLGSKSSLAAAYYSRRSLKKIRPRPTRLRRSYGTALYADLHLRRRLRTFEKKPPRAPPYITDSRRKGQVALECGIVYDHDVTSRLERNTGRFYILTAAGT